MLWLLGALALLGPAAVAAWWWTPVRYVALGDSLAAGVGSLLFVGYPRRFALLAGRQLRRPVALNNLARFGWTSADLLAALRRDERCRQAVAGAHLITLDIGGNDLRACDLSPDCLGAALERFRLNWSAIWAEIRRLNPTATCLCTNLYNPYPEGHPRRALAREWVGRLNAAMANPAVLAEYAVVGPADAHGRFDGRECRYTWMCMIGDIHPTDQGHAAMAGALDGIFRPAQVAGVAVWLGAWLLPLWERSWERRTGVTAVRGPDDQT